MKTGKHSVKANQFGAYPNLTTFIGEKRLLTVGNEALVSVIRPNTSNQARMLVAITCDGFRTDYPIAYDSGKIGWDNPEWFGERFKERARVHILRHYGTNENKLN